METGYYIEQEGRRDGPYDLVTVMRRIRADKIGPQTLILPPGGDHPVAAVQIEEIAFFFNRNAEDSAVLETGSKSSVWKALRTGWQFTQENSSMTVYAGGLLLLSLMLAAVLVDALGVLHGGLLAWMGFIVMHNIYLVFALRIYRGQTMSSEFINKQMAPILPGLVVGSLLLSLMMAGGLLLAVIPCLLVSVMYIFMPFFMLDRGFGPIAGMEASRVLGMKHKRRFVGPVAGLLAFHLISMLLIIPIPLTLPMFSAALADCYDGLVAS